MNSLYLTSSDFKSETKYLQVATESILALKSRCFGRIHVSDLPLSKLQSTSNLSMVDPKLGSMKYSPDLISG